MTWKAYQNEIIVLLSFLLMLYAYGYKQKQKSSQAEETQSSYLALTELKEVISMKKIWANKRTSAKIDSLKTLVPTHKVKWIKKSKKLHAAYTSLSANELNKLITKILNLAVQITELEIKKIGTNYNLELKCRW